MKKGRPRHPQIEAAYQQMVEQSIPYAGFEAYQAQFHNCKRRGIELRFSLREWWEWWQTDDRWSCRGRGGIMMLREGDSGHYEPGNVHPGTHADNMREMRLRDPSEAQKRAVVRFVAAGAAALSAWRDERAREKRAARRRAPQKRVLVPGKLRTQA